MISIDESEVQEYLEAHNKEAAECGDVEIPITPELVKHAADVALGQAEDAVYEAMTDIVCELLGE